MDDPDERAQLHALGRTFLDGVDLPVVLDEWQRLPETWDRVRRAVDSDPAPGRFILTGSASPSDAPVHTGAGRLANLRLRPLSLVERSLGEQTVSLAALLAGECDAPVGGRTTIALDDYIQEILRSGFPGIRDLPPAARRSQLDTYLQQTTRHDVADGSLRRARTLDDWLRAYAASTSTTATFAAVSRLASRDMDSPMTAKSARAYRDALEAMWVLDPIRGWSPSESESSRLTTSDKHQLCDPALAARLLNLGATGILGVGRPAVLTPDGARRRPRMLGPLFESLVTQSIQVYASLIGAQVRHLRTKGGSHEIDLIVEGTDRRVVAVEVKVSATPRSGDTRHLLWLRNRLGDRLADAVVITTGSWAYRDEDGVAVIPAALLGP